MGCCGQNREQAALAKTGPTAPAAAPVRTQTPVETGAAGGATVRLRYTGVARVQVRGPKTGRSYVASRETPDVSVDRRDAEGLMRIGLFQRR